MTKCDPFKYFKTSFDIIRLAVMWCIWLPQSHRNVEELLHERGIEISHETDFGVKGILPDGSRQKSCLFAIMAFRTPRSLCAVVIKTT